MTTTTETKETAKKKGSKPTDEIFPVGADGKPNYKGRIPAWKHSKGEGRNFSIGGTRYVMFQVRQKPAATEQPAAEGKGA